VSGFTAKYFRHCALTILLAVALVTTAGCATSDQETRKASLPQPISAQSPLTIMSFNIRLGLGQGNPTRDVARMRDQWGRNLNAVVEAIRSQDPAIVALQEVAGPDQLQELAQALGMNHAFVEHETGSKQPPWWGVGILSRYPITSTLKAALSENRNFIIATIDVGPRQIAVANIHRSHLEPVDASMPFLMAELAQIKHPILLVGDFNILPEALVRKNRNKKQLQPVLNRFVDTARAAHTESAAQAILEGTGHSAGRIDYVFAEKGKFKILDAGLVAKEHRDASNHVAYFAKLAFRK
jgi:endonuclease/exonuclease/phosphatase family metal-dependent hydrolase